MRRLLLALGAVSLVGAGPSGPVTIGIDDFAFAPASVTLAVGTEAVWTNRDDMPHTVTADAGSGTSGAFASGALDAQETFSYRFDRAGRFAYFCSLHPRMQGTVTVR